MEIWTAFKYSCLLPGKRAAFRLNRLPMDKAVLYMVLLVLAVSCLHIPALLTSGSVSGLNAIQFVFYFLFAYVLIVLCGVLAGISLLACAGYGLRKLWKRKLVYQHLWKMSCFAMTVPFILHTIIHEWVTKNGFVSAVLLIGYPLICLAAMILHYPETKSRHVSSKEGEEHG